jgi:integrase
MLTVENKTGREAWLSGFSEGSSRVYTAGYDYFIEFMNETEQGTWNDQRLLQEREEDVRNRSYAFEQKLIEFYNWLKNYQNQNFSDNTRKSYLKAIRSFFSFHRLDVKFTQQQKAKISKKPKPKRKFYEFTLEDLKKMVGVANPKEEYILLAGKDLGLRASDFVNLKQGTFIARDLNAEPPIALGEIYTVKEGVTAKPFLSADGVQAVKHWLTVLKNSGKLDANKKMLKLGKRELSKILKRLAKKAGIQLGTEEVRFHQLRVFLVTRLSQVVETNRWKQIVGKEVPESAYVKPFQLREDYAKVLPLVTVNTGAGMPQKAELDELKNAVLTLSKELQGYKATAKILTMRVEKLENEGITLRKMIARRDVKKKVEEIRESEELEEMEE